MTVNEEQRQVEVARELEAAARTLAHSTRDVPVPADSYVLLGELGSATTLIQQVCRQLAAWHGRVVDGTHYAGEDADGDGATGTVTAAAQLARAADALGTAADALGAAQTANGVVRWFDTPR